MNEDICSCSDDECVEFCDPPSQCVMRIKDSHLKGCVICSKGGYSWHDGNGNCLACKYKGLK